MEGKAWQCPCILSWTSWFGVSLPPQIWEEALLNRGVTCGSPSAQDLPNLTVTKCYIATSARTHAANYTPSAASYSLLLFLILPGWSRGRGEKKGEEGHRSEVWIFKLTPNSLNTLDFALKQSIRVFGKTHTPVSQLYSPIPVICACRWQWENKVVELRVVCLNVWYSFVYVCVWGQTKWRCAMFICPVSVSELTTVIVRRSHQHPFFCLYFLISPWCLPASCLKHPRIIHTCKQQEKHFCSICAAWQSITANIITGMRCTKSSRL